MDIRDDASGLGSPSSEEIERDRRLELLLDECVASSPAPGAELTAAILAARPFAPWEVRKARAWRAARPRGLRPPRGQPRRLPGPPVVARAPSPRWICGSAWSRPRPPARSRRRSRPRPRSRTRRVARSRGPTGLRPALGGLLLLSGGIARARRPPPREAAGPRRRGARLTRRHAPPADARPSCSSRHSSARRVAAPAHSEEISASEIRVGKGETTDPATSLLSEGSFS